MNSKKGKVHYRTQVGINRVHSLKIFQQLYGKLENSAASHHRGKLTSKACFVNGSPWGTIGEIFRQFFLRHSHVFALRKLNDA